MSPHDGPKRGGIAWRAAQGLNLQREAVHARWAIEDAPANRLARCQLDITGALAALGEAEASGDQERIARAKLHVSGYRDKERKLLRMASIPGEAERFRPSRAPYELRAQGVWQAMLSGRGRSPA